jgi:hypothetical protein
MTAVKKKETSIWTCGEAHLRVTGDREDKPVTMAKGKHRFFCGEAYMILTKNLRKINIMTVFHKGRFRLLV